LFFGSIIGIPLKSNDKVVGVMNLARINTGGFTPAELRLLSLLADQAAVAISNARLHEMVSRQAMSDIVTGLPNRRALDERIEEEVALAQRTDSQMAVLMMDLDGFKTVNDTYGHAVGDDVLRAAFNHLAGSMRSTDFLARYGGDELTLLLRHSDAETAKVISKKIVDLINSFSYRLSDGTAIKLGISGGIALFPFHSRDSSSLLRAADAALYQAKKHARGTFVMAQIVTGQLNPIALQRRNIPRK
jgi:diguanylate cyclase (GGDEF)-like protein